MFLGVGCLKKVSFVLESMRLFVSLSFIDSSDVNSWLFSPVTIRGR